MQFLLRQIRCDMIVCETATQTCKLQIILGCSKDFNNEDLFRPKGKL